MFNDPLPPPTSMITVPDLASIDARALRTALRLVLPAADADEIFSELPDDADLDDLRPVVRSALARARIGRFLARLPGRRDRTDEAMLGASSGVAAEPVIVLALHLGLRLDGRDIADILDTHVERVGRWLVAGRRSLDPDMQDPCKATAPLVGRCDDLSLDPDERIELVSHLNRCPTCQRIVERSRSVDATIVDEFSRLESTIGEQTTAGLSRLERARRAALLTGVALLLLTILLAGGALANDLIGNRRSAAPLIDGNVDAAYDGWLVMARADGTVHARNLATGTTRRIFASDDPIGGISGEVTLSPGGTRLMSYIGEFSQMSRSRVIVNALDGSEIGRVEWEGESTIFYPTGWIDERRILVSVFPVFQPGQTQEAFSRQFQDESRLLVVDVETGDSREVLRGNVAFGVPSPDGQFVAAARLNDRDATVVGARELTIEIWPLDGIERAEPLVTVENWLSSSGRPIWSDDGSRLFAVQAMDDGEQSPGVSSSGGVGTVRAHRLVAIDLDGGVQRLVDAGGDSDSAVFPVAAAPNGSSIVYLRADGSNVTRGISYWRVDIDGDEPVPTQLSGAISEAYGGNGVVWAPDGETVLVSEVTVPYLDPTVSEWSRWGASTTEIIAVDPDGKKTRLLTHYSVGDRLLGWLEEDALPDPANLDRATTFSAPAAVDGIPDATRLGVNSAASSDAAYLTLDDVSIGTPMVWQIGGSDTQRLRGSLADAIWLPGTTGLLTVSGGREGSRAASRLSVLAGTNPYAPLAFESLQFDPADLGTDSARRYAAPRVSPDGQNTSFFVVNDAGRVELWIANAEAGVRQVGGWNLPRNRIVEPPLVADWVDVRTLVVVEPRDWSRGMPETAAIQRVVVADDGSATMDDVIELAARGIDRGIEIIELAISDDAADIAWRTRHYADRSPSTGRSDTIHLAPISDLSRDVELTRGSPGNGLAWSDDGASLLVAIDRDIAIVDVGDLQLTVISGSDNATYPLWVGDNEVWYSADIAGSPTVMRVRAVAE